MAGCGYVFPGLSTSRYLVIQQHLPSDPSRLIGSHMARVALAICLAGAGGGRRRRGGSILGHAPRTGRNNRTGRLKRAITADKVYKLVRAYSAEPGLEIEAHALRATATTNALDHKADIAKNPEVAWAH